MFEFGWPVEESAFPARAITAREIIRIRTRSWRARRMPALLGRFKMFIVVGV